MAGVCVVGGGMHGRREGCCNRRCASYWNAFLFGTVVTCYSVYTASEIYPLFLFRDNLGSVPNPSAGRKMTKPVHVLGKYFTYNCTKIFNIYTNNRSSIHGNLFEKLEYLHYLCK